MHSSLKVLLLFIMFSGTKVQAQLCSGSLGDPVAWITFGAGSGGGSLAQGITNYTYSGSSCPNDGSYTITNLSFGCFSSSWHTLVGDHTPDDAGGRYMLVNASNDPGDFYKETINNLCPNTTYEFSAYVLNMLKPEYCEDNANRNPNLTFTIETLSGVAIVTHNTGNIEQTATPSWKQVGTFFTTPSNVSSVVVRIKNNAPGGCGNDLALDDIMFRPCGPAVSAKIALNGQTEMALCENDTRSFLLSASYSNTYADTRLQWQISTDNGRNWTNIPGATSSSYLRAPSGVGYFQYRLLIADGGNINNPVCRIASKPVTIQVTPPPFVQATNYVFSCYGSTVDLFAAGGSVYQWTGPNGFSSNMQAPSIPNIQFQNAGKYVVTVTTIFGCTNKDSTIIDVYPAVKLNVSPDASICEGQSVQLNASGGNRYLWEPKDGLSDPNSPSPVASPKDSIVYKVTVLNEYNCYDTARVRVNVWKKPVADAGPDLKTLKDRPVQLLANAGGTDIRYNWSPNIFMNNPTLLRPTVTPTANNYPQEFIYRMDVISNRGCGTASDEVKVTVFETVKIPNTFTPNGDGYNDVWQIDLLDLFTNAVIDVYNTAGALVYRSIGYNKPWDGRRNGQLLPAGTYYYVIDLKVMNARKLSGYVTIIR